MYTIIAVPNTAKGYFFTASGNFSTQGNYNINLSANGTPINESILPGDQIVIVFNGNAANCNNLFIPI